jgi:tRNA nucleotidyltransferase/poly(A) polymerase
MANKEQENSEESSYAGRWVARVRGRIVAQGGTPAAARRAAHGTRPKDKAAISFMHPDPPIQLPPLTNKIASIAGDQAVYMVGGAVRDALQGEVLHDLDFAVRQDAIGLARRVARELKADFYVLEQAFDTARVIVAGPAGTRDVLDFAAFRGSDIVADLEARDFTINAMALDLHERTIIDPLHGAGDLRGRLIRACAAGALQDDPIRILRAVRLAAALEFKIDPATRAAMKQSASRLSTTSPERQRDELFKMLGGRRPAAAFRALEILGVLTHVLPELGALKRVKQPAPHVHDVWEHTLSVMRHLEELLDLVLLDAKPDRAGGMLSSLFTLGLGRFRAQFKEHFTRSLNPDRTARSLLLFAALFHDVAKPTTKSIDGRGRIRFLGHEVAGADLCSDRCRRFNLSNDETARIRKTVENHLRFTFLAIRMATESEPPSRRAIYRFFRAAGDTGVELVLLGLADLRGGRGHTLTEQAWSAWVSVARSLLENLWERPGEVVAPPRLLDGTALMRELTLEQGPVVGRLLEATREAQAVGEVSTRAEALGFAHLWMKDQPG